MSSAATLPELILRRAPQAYWRFEEASGTAVADSSGYGRNLTTEGGATRGVDGSISGGGFGVQFDGVNDGATGGDILDPGTSDFAIEFWIRTAADYAPAEAGIVGKYHTSTPWTPYFEIMLTDDGAETGRIRAAIHDGTGILNCYGSHRINDGGDHHVFVVFDRDAGLTVWTDGEARFASGKREASMNTAGAFRIGGNGAEAGLRLAATLDEMAVYFYAPDDEQVRQHHTYGRMKIAAPIAAPTGLAAQPPLDIVEVDWPRDPATVRYRRQVNADAPAHYWPFEGATYAARLVDKGFATTLYDLTGTESAVGQFVGMATGGTNIAGASNDWSNPSRVTADDNSSATAIATSDDLEATFNLSTIPDDATITSISVRVERMRSAGGTADDDLTVRVNGTNGTRTGFAIPDVMTASDFSVANNWGHGALTGAQLKAGSGTTVRYRAFSTGGSTTVSVDFIRITVNYTRARTFASDTAHKLPESADDMVAVGGIGWTVPVGAALDAVGGLSGTWWMKPTALPSVDAQFGSIPFTVSLLTTGVLRITVSAGSVDSPSAIPLNVWTHVAVIYDEEKIRLFIDGQEVASSALSVTGNHGDGGLGGNGYTGYLDEVAIYGHPLPLDRPMAHYRSAFDVDAVEERYVTINHRVNSISRRYGRQNQLGRMEAAEVRIIVDDEDRALEPGYPGSPYFPHVRVNRPVRWRRRYPANLAEDPLFTGALDADWTDTVTNATVTTNVGGQSPPVGTTAIRAVRDSGTATASVVANERIPVTPGVPLAISFYAKKVGAASPGLTLRLHEIDLRDRDHGARTLAEIATAVPGGAMETTFGAYGSGGSINSDWHGWKGASQFSKPSDGAVSKLTVRASVTTAATNLIGAIYADDGGAPGALIATTTTVLAPVAAMGYVDLPFATPLDLDTGSYWLSVHAQGGQGDVDLWSWSDPARPIVQAESPHSDPFVPTAPNLDGPLDIYATYTADQLPFPDGSDVDTDWERFGAIAMLPADIVQVRLELVMLNEVAAASTVYVTGVQVEHGPTVHDFAEGAWYDRLIDGPIEALPSSQPSHRRTSIDLTCGDGRAPLREPTVYGPTVQEEGGPRIHTLLDRAFWSEDKRAIDPGEHPVAAYDYGDDPVAAIDEIERIADSELGLFFIGQDGRATFHDGGHRFREEHASYGQVLFGDGPTDEELPWVRHTTDNGEGFIYNDVRVQPEALPSDEITKKGQQVAFGSVGAGSSSSVTVALPGAKLGDAVTVHPQSSLPSGVTISARVVATDQVAVVATNAYATGSPPVPTAQSVGTITVKLSLLPEPSLGEQIAVDALSRKRNSLRTLHRNTMLISTTVAKAQAETLLAHYREPRKRIPSIVIEPARDPRLWAATLGLDLSDLVTLRERPQITVPRGYREMVMSDDPAAYWMLEDVDLVAVDEVGRSGAKMNGVAPGTILNATASRESPLVNRVGSRYFDGSGDRVTVGDVASVRLLGSATFEAWVNPGAIGARRNIIHKAFGGEGSLVLEANGRITFMYGTSGADSGTENATPTGWQGVTTTATLAADAWSHVAAVRDFDDAEVRIYIDGVLAASEATLYAAATASSLPLYLGDGNIAPLLGWLAHPAVYRHALSVDRIGERVAAAVRGAGLPGDEFEVTNAWVERIEETVSLNPPRTTIVLGLSS